MECPKCRVPMMFFMQVDLLSDGTERVTYYYRCQRCGLKMEDAMVIITKEKNGVKLKVAEIKDESS